MLANIGGRQWARHAQALCLVVPLCGLLSCSFGRDRDAGFREAPDETSSHTDTRRRIHNVIPVTAKLTSGGIPDGDAAFDQLEAMGIRTIISVDGAAPDLARARARGMRYVHLPVGYHGISGEQQATLARALRDLEGPIFLHCHHGRHRGPAAAASAAVVLGDMTPEEGVAFLKKAGTAPSYTGLYECVRTAHRAGSAALDEAAAEFPEIAALPGFVTAMAEAQDTYDHLAEIKDAGWSVPEDHPDLVAVTEAAQLEGLLRAMVDDPDIAGEPPDFHERMRASAAMAQELEDAIAAEAPPAELSKRLAAINDACKSCHVKYRDAAIKTSRSAPRALLTGRRGENGGRPRRRAAPLGVARCRSTRCRCPPRRRG